MDWSGRIFLLLLSGAVCLGATGCDRLWELSQKLKAPEAPVPAPTEPQPPLEVPNPVPPLPPSPKEGAPPFNPMAQVSILGYHDFSSTRPSSDMVIHPDRLRSQMEVIKQSKIPVVRMSDYLAWKKGQKPLPDPCLLITCDDGWEGVYTEAYPVFKAYGFPFSIYLYQNYLGGSGRSLSVEEIREMMTHGCEIGSHSASHADLTKARPDADKWLQSELTGSLEFLRATFGVENVLPVFAFPYGKYNNRILELCSGSGYELGITVAPKKAAYGEPNLELGRFIIHGDDDTNFNAAMSFRGAFSPTGGSAGLSLSGLPEVTLWPEDQGIVTTRLPRIETDLSKVEGIEPSGITMRVSGFGEVPCVFDARSGRLHFQVTEPLRSERVQVQVRFQRKGREKPDTIKWAFSVDLQDLYLNESLEAQPPMPTKPAGSGS
jgi:peptidoglycan/xylan/chitin deacetylase (PgdA/CDA1 family)